MNRLLCSASFVLALAVVAALAVAPAQAQIFVREGASGTGTASDPYGSLQDALADGSSNEIRVAEGTYVPSSSDQSASFVLTDGVTILGGYASDFSTRDPSTFITVLGGDIDQDGTSSGNTYRVVVSPSTLASSATLDGLVISGGNASQLGGSDAGAGLFVDQSSPTVRNVTFRNNQAIVGGGAVLIQGGSPTFESVVFDQNTATATVGGGAVYVIEADPLTIRQSTFVGNQGLSGGALNISAGTVDIDNSEFTQNTSADGGGAIFADTGDLTITRSIFDQNTTSGTTGGGGAIYQVTGSSRITNTVFAGNTTTGTVPGGAIHAAEGSSASIFNSVFTGNAATEARGGAIFLEGADLTATHITALSNDSPDGSAVHAGDGGTATLQNIILWPQTGPVIATTLSGTVSVGAALIDGGLPTAATLIDGAPPVLDANPDYTDAGGSDGVQGTLDDDVRLSEASPAVGYGLFSALPPDDSDLDEDGNTTEFLPLDLDETARVEDSHLADGDSGGPDLGAYETPTILVIPGTADDPPEDSDRGEDSGWRMMAMPAPSTVGDIDDDIFFGPFGLSGSPPTAMIYKWNDSVENDTSEYTGVWDGLSSLSTPIASGEGFILYFFDDDRDPIRPSSPLEFDVPGERPIQDVVVENLSTTALYHLIGNPYPQAFDVSGLTIGGTSGFQAFVWVWDPATESYIRREQGTAGDEVASWQGFFIERSVGSSATSVTFNASGRISEVPFVGKRGRTGEIARIGLRLQAVEEDSVVFSDDLPEVSFRRDAQNDWDVWDATRPIGPSGERARPLLAFKGERADRWVEKAHESRPLPLRYGVRIPLSVRPMGWSGTMRIDAPRWTNIPKAWTVRLIDTKGTPSQDDDVETELEPDGGGYTFEVDNEDAKEAGAHGSVGLPAVVRTPRELKRGRDGGSLTSSDFVLVIAPGESGRGAWGIQARAEGGRAILSWPDDLPANIVIEQSHEESPWTTIETRPEGEAGSNRLRVVLSDLEPGRHEFRLKADVEGTVAYSEVVTVDITMSEAVRIEPVAPNPVSQRSTMTVTVRDPQEVRVELFDVLGRRIVTLFRDSMDGSRPQQVEIDAGELDLASGTYVVRVSGETFVDTQRIAVVR
ncbi:hypothetical protein CRI94_05320 [Longibacter salinarum]|uniref:Right handed beta helix domain-containing protein n=1 Tax=Longibacter salinarum TaxID=1850348 RepID=A0A2A8D0W5_9BACT|nr:right-handed parallel beta-helix repeat-containing protein [Longibacter salinarum]PEN14447.1 hypothetical protein CRI94_05320 [Longibacter salinarum]